MILIKTYAKAILTFIAALCVSLGTGALDGHLSLAEILLAVGGSLAGSGVVATVPNAPQVVKPTL